MTTPHTTQRALATGEPFRGSLMTGVTLGKSKVRAQPDLRNRSVTVTVAAR